MKIVGMPNICIMPKKAYNIEIEDDSKALVIPLPRKGNFKDLPLSTGMGSREFNIVESKYTEKNEEILVVNMNDLNGAMICSDLYPKLDDDQVFAISHMVIKEDTILVLGRETKVSEVENVQ